MENEYGSYGCDKVYLANLRDLIKDLVSAVLYLGLLDIGEWACWILIVCTTLLQAGDQVLLFSTDGDNERLVMCGQVAIDIDKAPRLSVIVVL